MHLTKQRNTRLSNHRPASSSRKERSSESCTATSGFVRPTQKQSQKTTEIQRRAADLLQQEIAFIANPSFLDSTTDHETTSQRVRDIELGNEIQPADTASGLPAHLARLCSTSLLTPEEERECFRRMNYLKHRANSLRAKLSAQSPSIESVEEIEHTIAVVARLRDHLIRSNTRLVMSIARKYSGGRLTFDELLSHGIASLMHALEKFDYARGYRFSTYATCAIRRDMYRLVMSNRRDSQRYATGMQDGFAETCEEDKDTRLNESEWNRLSDSIKQMLTVLDDRERTIITLRFDLADTGDALSYSRLGKRMGISKERVRQLANRALDKLRELAGEHKLSSLLA